MMGGNYPGWAGPPPSNLHALPRGGGMRCTGKQNESLARGSFQLQRLQCGGAGLKWRCGRGQRRRGGARDGRSPGHAAVPAARHSTTQQTNVRRVHHNPNQTSVHRYAHFATTRNNQSSTVTYLTNHKNCFCESGNVPPFYRWNVSDDQHWSCRNVVSAGLREMEGHRTCHDPGPAHRRAADV